jgi:hypothetical protein
VSKAIDDSVAAIDAYDRVISIYENNNDPLLDLADTTLAVSNRLWADQAYKLIKFSRWYYVRGKTIMVD